MLAPAMTTPSDAPISSRPTSGKNVVIGLLLLALLVAATITAIRYASREERETARLAMDPGLKATLHVRCAAQGQPNGVELRTTGRCPTGGRIDLQLENPSEDLGHFTWTMLGQQGFLIGQSEPTTESRISLGGEKPGPRLFAFVFSDRPLNQAALEDAIRSAPAGDVPAQILEFESQVSAQRDAGTRIRIERLHFRIVE